MKKAYFCSIFLAFLAGCATDRPQYEPPGTKHTLPHPKVQERRKSIERSATRALPVPMFPSDEVEEVESVDLPPINLPPDPEEVIEREKAGDQI